MRRNCKKIRRLYPKGYGRFIYITIKNCDSVNHFKENRMITSTSNPRIKQVVLWQSKAKERRKDGIFLAEGFKMYGEAPLDWVREVYLAQGALEKAKQDLYIWKKLEQTGYETVSDEVMEKMADTQTPQGILTVLKRPEYEEEELYRKPNGLYVVLEDLQDPGNLGTIMRTGEGAGVTAVIMSKGTVDLFNPKTIRATMGSVYRIPFIISDNLQESLQKMKKNGIKTYAAHLSGTQYFTGTSYCGGTAFLIGNEGNGLMKETADAADAYIKIPMEGRLESLNAAVATALLVYEAKRQRTAGTPKE